MTTPTITVSLKTATGIERKSISVEELITKFKTNKVSWEHYCANKEQWETSPSLAFFKMLHDGATPAQNKEAPPPSFVRKMSKSTQPYRGTYQSNPTEY